MINAPIFSLAVSAALFMTNPLFGMNAAEAPQEKGIVHQVPQINKLEGMGQLCDLPEEVTIKVILEFLAPRRIRPLPPEAKMISTFTRVSKAMYNLTWVCS